MFGNTLAKYNQYEQDENESGVVIEEESKLYNFVKLRKNPMAMFSTQEVVSK
jgi:hypothetical protein